MPTWFEHYLKTLEPDYKAELGFWILTENDNQLTTEILAVIDRPGVLLSRMNRP